MVRTSLITRARKAVSDVLNRPVLSIKKNPYSSSIFGYNTTPRRTLIDFDSYYTEGYNENALIYSAVSYKSKSVTQAKLTAYKEIDDKGNFEKLPKNDPLQILLRKPNPYQSGDEFQSLQNMFFNLTGNAFTYLERKNNEVIRLWPLNPNFVYIIPDDNGEIAGYEYQPAYLSGERFPILPENMAHWKLPNPLDTLNGLGFGQSPLNAMAMSGDVDNMITRFLNIFFKHGAMPVGLLKFKDMALDETEIGEIRERWKEIYGGYTNWADIGVLDGHGEYQRIGLTFEEMNFEKLDNRNESRILAVFGVPISLLPTVSALQGSTYNNKYNDRKMFWEDTMMYELEVVEQELGRFFNNDENGIYLKWDLSEVKALKNDVNVQIDGASKLVNIGVPPKYAFNTVGLTIEEYEGIDLSMLPNSLVPVNVMQEREKARNTALTSRNNTLNSQNSSDSSDNVNEDVSEENTPDNEAKNNSFLALTEVSSSFDLETKKRIYKEFDEIAVGHEKAFSDTTEKLFEQDKREVLSLVNQTKTKALQLKASIKWDDTLQDVITYYETKSPANWRNEFVPLISGVYSDVGNYWAKELGVSFNIRNIEGEFALSKYTLIFAQEVSKTSNDQVKGVIQQGIKEGWSIDTMTNNIDTLFEHWKTGKKTPQDLAWMEQRKPIWRRELIARTETTRAANSGARELYKRWGMEQKEWLSTMDDRTRDTHEAMNGQIKDIDQPFDSPSGAKLMQPGDFTAPLSETAACRCTTLPVIPKNKVFEDLNDSE